MRSVTACVDSGSTLGAAGAGLQNIQGTLRKILGFGANKEKGLLDLPGLPGLLDLPDLLDLQVGYNFQYHVSSKLLSYHVSG
jgi:hypothetical protein